MRARKQTMATIIQIVLLLGAADVCAQVPQFVTYSGRLTDGTGAQQTLPGVTLTFRIYDAAEGSTLLWEQTIEGVTIEDGYFTVMLGDGSGPDDQALNITSVFAANDQTFLAVAVGDGLDMEPRQPIGSVPYAVSAGTLGSVVFTEGGKVGVGTPHPESDFHVVGDARVDGTIRRTGDEVMRRYWGVAGSQWSDDLDLNNLSGDCWSFGGEIRLLGDENVAASASYKRYSFVRYRVGLPGGQSQWKWAYSGPFDEVAAGDPQGNPELRVTEAGMVQLKRAAASFFDGGYEFSVFSMYGCP